MSGIIPKEQLANYQRWQFNAFDQPATPQAAPPIADPVSEIVEPIATPSDVHPQLPSAEEIAQIQEEARSTGYEAGFAEGQQAASAAAREGLARIAEQVSAVTGNLEAALAALDQQVAEQTLALALEVAKQVIRGTIRADKGALLPVIREAIALLPLHHAHISLALNPTDAVNVRELMGEFLSQNGTQIIEDASVSPGGCQIRAGASEIDASIETRWQRVLESIGAEPQAWINPT
jgi:flagellar assembly protein FliH